jgi:hypothetical protein
LVKDGRIQFNTNIWDTTWLAYCLSKKGVKLTKKLSFSLSNKEHKTDYIHGLLDFATDFMNFDKDCDAHYEIFFQEEIGQRKRLEFEREYFKTIDKDNFEEIIIEDIERYLFKGNKIENFDGKISYITSRKIFLLIDCLFLNENYATYEFHDGFKSSKIIFENAECCYCLHFDESD